MEEEPVDTQPNTYQIHSPITRSTPTKRRRPFIIIAPIVLVIIVLLSVIALRFQPLPPEISNILLSLSESHSDYLDVTVLVGSSTRSSLEGEADLVVYYENNVIYWEHFTGRGDRSF